MMCRKLLWKAHVMNAVQFQEECCGKKNISCTFSSLCDLDMFYYFKHLIVLFKTSLKTQFSRGILTAFAQQSQVDPEEIIEEIL